MLDEIAARLIRDEPRLALQYTPSEGLPSVREYLVERQELLHGRRPPVDELIVTSGGMEAITLLRQTMLDPADTVAAEAPTYLGALMAFARYDAEVEGMPMDEDGLCVDVLEERLAAGLRPKFVYVIPEFQNPTGRTLPPSGAARLGALPLARRAGLRGRRLPRADLRRRLAVSLWSLAPDVVVQAGTFSKIFAQASGWARWGPREVGPDGGGQADHRPVLGRPGPAADGGAWPGRALRPPHPRRPRPLRLALEGTRAGVPAPPAAGVHVDAPRGGFLTWLALPEHVDTSAMSRPPPPRASPTCPGRPSTSGTTADTRCGCPSATCRSPTSTWRSSGWAA